MSVYKIHMSYLDRYSWQLKISILYTSYFRCYISWRSSLLSHPKITLSSATSYKEVIWVIGLSRSGCSWFWAVIEVIIDGFLVVKKVDSVHLILFADVFVFVSSIVLVGISFYPCRHVFAHFSSSKDRYEAWTIISLLSLSTCSFKGTVLL